jgi:MFS family permease
VTDPTFDSPDEPVTASAWGLLAFLTFLNVLNFVDRLLIAAVAPLLIKELGLSRAQIGLLAGFGFLLLFTVAGMLLGFAADRWRRIPLVAAGLTLWSGMTAWTGLARSFVGLALPRLFVGVGESTLGPSALSMLGDAFPKRRLAFASGVYYAGIPLGSAASMIVSSLIAPRFGWRVCFYVLGGVGLAAAALLLFVREPARRVASATHERPPFARLARELCGALRRRRDLALTLAGGALLCFGASAVSIHVVTWLVEERGYPFADAAFTAGVVGLVSGLLGNVAGGAFGDRWARRRANGHLASLVPLTVLFALASAAFYSLPKGTPLFYAAWFLAAGSASSWFGPLLAAVQEEAPADARASTIAFAILVLNLFGVGPGPLVSGVRRVGALNTDGAGNAERDVPGP